MIANWIHIVIVHFAILGVPWLAYRVFTNKDEALDSKRWKSTYSGLIILGIIATIAYFTGPKAAEWTKDVVDTYSQDQVEDHALWGRIGFVVQVIGALIGIMGWASILQEEKPYRGIPVIIKVLLIVNTLVLFYTAHLGGVIRRVDLLF